MSVAGCSMRLGQKAHGKYLRKIQVALWFRRAASILSCFAGNSCHPSKCILPIIGRAFSIPQIRRLPLLESLTFYACLNEERGNKKDSRGIAEGLSPYFSGSRVVGGSRKSKRDRHYEMAFLPENRAEVSVHSSRESVCPFALFWLIRAGMLEAAVRTHGEKAKGTDTLKFSQAGKKVKGTDIMRLCSCLRTALMNCESILSRGDVSCRAAECLSLRS